ncbi:hypothetical protein ABT56_00625 [Photobacterium aquae]|uniref:Uncharacterized protein n=1 Tax=Photobacterium aquae TaxID=1195763 RepID=A0A0J1HDB3_9GAMM|nr:hypothetical protein [Photobacterium aquae]KLV09621.1 hypothetical protein ABT56_00625 [Photobacterium aquae]
MWHQIFVGIEHGVVAVGINDFDEGWEILVSDYARPIAAKRLIANIYRGSDMANGIIRSQIAENSQHYRCAQCRGAVYLAGGQGRRQCLHFRHNTKSPENKQKAEGCFFCNPNREQCRLYNRIFRAEGEWHMQNKERVANILALDPRIEPDSVATERYIFSTEHTLNIRRQPDIYCRDRDGNHWVFELTRWWLHPETAVERQKFYRKLGYNLVWLFSPECREENRSTFHLLLYGANYHDEMTLESITCEGAQFNAFELSESALEKSDSEGELYLDVIYPSFVVDDNLGTLMTSYHNRLMSMHDLILDPCQRLPYGVETACQLQQAKAYLAEVRNELLQAEFNRRYKSEVKDLTLIRRSLGEIRKIRRVGIDESSMVQIRERLSECRARLPEIGGMRAIRIEKLIIGADCKAQLSIERYLKERTAREEQISTLCYEGHGFINQFSGQPLHPDGEVSRQAEQLSKQLEEIGNLSFSRRITAASRACHRRYIELFIYQMNESVGKVKHRQYVKKNRPLLFSLQEYCQQFDERQLLVQLNKLHHIVDNHTIYLQYCELAAMIAHPMLPSGYLDDVLDMYDLLSEYEFNQQRTDFNLAVIRRYARQAVDDFAALHQWDKALDYRTLLPLAIQVAEEDESALATMLGCHANSLSRLPEIRDKYVEQASESVESFFVGIGQALSSLISKAERASNTKVLAAIVPLAEKLFTDCYLYTSSFSDQAVQSQKTDLMNAHYEPLFDKLYQLVEPQD